MVRSSTDYTYNSTLLEETRELAAAKVVAQKRCQKTDDEQHTTPLEFAVADGERRQPAATWWKRPL